MDDSILTAMVVANGVISLAVLYFVAPLYTLKGKLCMLVDAIKSHDRRIQSMEDRI